MADEFRARQHGPARAHNDLHSPRKTGPWRKQDEFRCCGLPCGACGGPTHGSHRGCSCGPLCCNSNDSEFIGQIVVRHVLGWLAAIMAVHNASKVPFYALADVPSYGSETAPNWHWLIGYRGRKLWADPSLFMGPHCALLAIFLAIFAAVLLRHDRDKSFGAGFIHPAFTATALALLLHSLPVCTRTWGGTGDALPHLGHWRVWLGMWGCLIAALAWLLGKMGQEAHLKYLESRKQKRSEKTLEQLRQECADHMETVEEGRRVPLASPDRRGERPDYYDDEDELRTRLEQADQEKFESRGKRHDDLLRFLRGLSWWMVVPQLLYEAIAEFFDVCSAVVAWLDFSGFSAEELEGECVHMWCDRFRPGIGWIALEGDEPHPLSGTGPYADISDSIPILGPVLCMALFFLFCIVATEAAGGNCKPRLQAAAGWLKTKVNEARGERSYAGLPEPEPEPEPEPIRGSA